MTWAVDIVVEDKECPLGCLKLLRDNRVTVQRHDFKNPSSQLLLIMVDHPKIHVILLLRLI
jgi:hypothetical protein